MKKNKNILAIIVILILIIVYIVQLVMYNNGIKKANQKMDDGKEYALTDQKAIVEGTAAIYPRNTQELIEKSGDSISYKQIGYRVFKLVNEDFNYLYKYGTDKDEDAIRTKIGQNEEDINSLNIASTNDIIGIYNQIKRIKSTNSSKFVKSEFDLDTYSQTNTQCKCLLKLYYEKNNCLYIKLDIPYNEGNEIVLENYNPLDVIFDKYTGPVKEEEVTKLIDKYRDAVFKFFNGKLERKSVGEIKSFYDNNKELVNGYYIYSADDLLKASLVFGSFSMSSTTKITYYDIEESDVKDDNYKIYNVILHNTDTESTAKLAICLATKNNISPAMKITGTQELPEVDGGM